MRATADQLLRSLIIVRLWNGRCAARNAHGVHSAHAAACTRRVPCPDRSKREKRWRAVDNRRWRKPSPLCSLYPSSRSSCSVHTATPQNRRKSSRVSFRLTNRVTANETSLCWFSFSSGYCLTRAFSFNEREEKRRLVLPKSVFLRI